MVAHCNILDVQFSPSVADEQLRTLIMRTALLAAFVTDFPTAPISTFTYVNADPSEKGPAVIMLATGVCECVRLFGGGWDVKEREDGKRNSWKAAKMVNGVSVEFLKLDLAAACYLLGGAGDMNRARQPLSVRVINKEKALRPKTI